MLKPIFTTLCFVALLSGCHSQVIDFALSGRVVLPNGQPSVGGQGELCVKLTASSRAELICHPFFTDAQGRYRLTVPNYKVVRFTSSAFEITKAEVFLKVKQNFFKLQNVNVKNFDSAVPFVQNFVNPIGYSYGRGVEIESVFEQANAAADASNGDAILLAYANKYLTQLNPLEVISIGSAFRGSGTNDLRNDYLILEYAKAMTQKHALSRADVILLAKAIAYDVHRDEVLDLFKP